MSGGFHAALRALRRIDEAREVEEKIPTSAEMDRLRVRRDPIEHAVRNFRRGSVHGAAVVEFAALAGEAGVTVGELLRELQRRES